MKLFINPSGRRVYLRDYYCPSVAKTSYYYPPIDFIYMSAIEERIDFTDLIIGDSDKDISYGKYKEIIVLTSILSWKEDFDYLKKLKNRCKNTKMGVTGDLTKAFGEKITEKFEFADFVVEDFFIYMKERNRDYRFIPQFEKFAFEKYFFPFFEHYPVAHILTDYGCVYKCDFCPLGKIAVRYYPCDFIERQLKELKRLGYRELHIRDQTFGVKDEHFYMVSDLLGQYGFTWSCFNRIDIMNEEKLMYLKNAGCHTIIFGIETANEESRQEHIKNFNNVKIDEILLTCRKIGIKTVGTFIIGLPNENEDDFQKTILYAKSLPLDYASFNKAMYRLNTKMSRAYNITDLEKLKAVELYCNDESKVENYLRKANIEFYLHPTRIRFLLGELLKKHRLLCYPAIFYNLLVRR
ncbi:MAG: radical SAM protein [Desulfobacteraceae bacterium]|nr:radical SAM protein [Desulfobacteraceae bacterium]